MRLFKALTVVLVLVLSIISGTASQSLVACDSYDFQEAAQFILNDANADALDPDGDGVACEDLPSRSDQSQAPSDTENTQQAPTNESATSSELTAQEETYFSELLEDSETFATSFMDAGELFGEAGVDPTLLLDQDWNIDVAVQFATLQQVGIDAETLDPSPRQQHIHDLWLETNRLTGLAITDITQGVDNLDPNAINTGSNRLVYASNLVDDMTVAITAFNSNPNVPAEPTYVIGPVADCEPFDTFADAQEYYDAHPEEQATIDPNFDGRACEVFFGQ